MQWLLSHGTEDAASRLSSELSLHPLAARVLASRGFSEPKSIESFLSTQLEDLPDPFSMRGMSTAVQALIEAVQNRRKITLYGDYDVDGVCSTALLSMFLEEVGAKVATYIPHRLGEGYGLNSAAIERIAADGTALLVTLDCGITSAVEIARANALGLSVIVVDHHSVPEKLPPAVAVLNPHQPGCDYPTKHLCAAGVAFNVAMALRKRLREQGAFGGRREPNLRSYLDLVCLATIADVVPLTGANRILVAHGLSELATGNRPGVRALKEVAGVPATSPVTGGQVGFKLAPRINAAGRLSDASVGLALLRSKDPAEAMRLATELDVANRDRQELEHNIFTSAIEQAKRYPSARSLVLCSEEWHAGVVGIVASRLVERFHRPSIVIAMTEGLGRGSGRGIEPFHLFDALSACAGYLAKFGGHRHAAGLSVEAGNLDAFREAFERVASAQLTDEDLIPRCRIDAVVGEQEIDFAAAQAIRSLGPFGPGHPEPVFAVRRVGTRPKLLRSKRVNGADHLKLVLESGGLEAIGFGMGDRLLMTEGAVDLAFNLSVDEWNGRERLQLKLKDLRAAA